MAALSQYELDMLPANSKIFFVSVSNRSYSPTKQGCRWKTDYDTMYYRTEDEAKGHVKFLNILDALKDE